MAQKLGYEGVLLYNATAATYPADPGDATVPCTTLRSVSPDLSRGEADMTTRANQGQVATRPGRRTISLELEFVYNSNTSDAPLQALMETAYFAATDEVISLKFLDATGGSGFLADFGVYSYSVSQPGGDEPQILTVTVKPRTEVTAV